MFFFLISVLAGVLTILAPCVLPLLPVIIGSSNVDDNETSKKVSKKSIRIILSLALSVIVFTLLLKASTLLIDIPNSFWTWFSGGVIVILGIVMLFPDIWAKNKLVSKLKLFGDKRLSKGFTKNNSIGDYIVGASLGPVFSTCSPTYLFIIATVLPAGFLVGFTYLIGFVIGLIFSLLLVAYFGQSIVNKITNNARKAEITKKIFGGLILLVGISIITGFDKKIETWVLDSGYGATINLEQNLIDKFDPNMNETSKNNGDSSGDSSGEVKVENRALQSAFPDTDWSKANSIIEKVVSGGPGKDGIPAIDDPKFESVSQFDRSDDILAVVLQEGDEVRVYPYNILTWHEIVNDEIGDKKVAVTFCPLCGSAAVFDRKLEKGDTTFGVSGFLLESNMIMYDRDTESLWQQSTGKALVGDYFETQLEHVPFQLLTMGEIKSKFPNALVLSENTGYSRNYDRNPYSGYENTDNLLFDTSSKDNTFEMKEIMVVFRIEDEIFTFPMSQLNSGVEYNEETDFGDVNISKNDGEIFISRDSGDIIPFYFEMWFSVHAQHGNDINILLEN